MKFLSSIGLLSASLAVAQGTPGEFLFAVSKFQAGATPHSSVGHVSFDLSFGSGDSSTSCSARPPAYQSFPSINQAPCEDTTASFNLTMSSDGADLEIWQGGEPGVFVRGTHHITSKEIVWANEQSPTGRVQVYQGAQDFTIKATTV
ncbi:hypothetical protein F5X96DRAFT_632762 [Biscogniauxia mediterranea]|nr:hypothetical protein F5X96DRAFT_632762 [Biscogniauxia mediterranea]